MEDSLERARALARACEETEARSEALRIQATELRIRISMGCPQWVSDQFYDLVDRLGVGRREEARMAAELAEFDVPDDDEGDDESVEVWP